MVPASAFPLAAGIATTVVADPGCTCANLAGVWARPGRQDDDAYLLAVMSGGSAFTVTSEHPSSWKKATGICNGPGNITIRFDNGHSNTGTCTGDGTDVDVRWSDGSTWARKGGSGGGGNASFAIVLDSGVRGLRLLPSKWLRLQLCKVRCCLRAR